MMAPCTTNLAHDGGGSPRVKVGLVQINDSLLGPSYLPYSVALLQAYVEQFARQPDRFDFKIPIYKRSRIGQIVESLTDADVIGFSTYVWNGRISLEIARRLKERNSHVLIVFGGPNLPTHSEMFLRQNPFVDIAIHGEGERSFLALLEEYPDINREAINGASFIGTDGVHYRNPEAQGNYDLDEIPSPYLAGVFDRLIAEYPEERWIGTWETNRGCPFQCSFCGWVGSAIATKVRKFDIARLQKEIDWFANNRINTICCCDANFGMLKRDIDIANYVAEKKLATGFPAMMTVQTTKNATKRAYVTQKILSDAGLSMRVGLSLQSLDHDTLVNIQRDNVSLNTYFELQQKLNRDHVATYCELILGLPGETYDSFVEGTTKLIESGQHDRIKFYNLTILPNAQMANPSYRKRFGMETVQTRIIVPGPRTENDEDVREFQDVVISTASMPAADWQRARVFGWMTALLHFDKLAQIPFVIAHRTAGISYRRMIEAVMDVECSFPLLAEIRDFLFRRAASIQNGGPEYPLSTKWLNIYWPTDEYVFIKMTADGKLDQFFSEMTTLLRCLVGPTSGSQPLAALEEALVLNRALIKQPFALDDITLKTEYDVMGFYREVLTGKRAQLRRVPMITRIERSKEAYTDFQAWCRQVVSWGKQKEAYLYSDDTKEAQASKHRQINHVHS